MGLFDGVLSKIGQHVGEKLYELFRPELLAALEKAVREWATAVGSEFGHVDPHAVLAGLHPSFRGRQQEEDSACWREIYQSFERGQIPTENQWYDALHERWQTARRVNSEVEQVFAVKVKDFEYQFRDLARRLATACTVRDALFKSDLHTKVSEIHDILVQKNSTELSKVSAAASFIANDEFDKEIECARALIDEHVWDRARLRLEALQTNSWDQLSERQQYRVLNLLANTFVKEHKQSTAADLLLRALVIQPNDEKAQVNGALALEFQGNVRDAHASADRLRREYPASIPAWCIWLRTFPEGTSIGDILQQVPSETLNDSQMQVAVAWFANREGDVDTAVDFAQKATAANSDWPGAWLIYGHALSGAGYENDNPKKKAELLAKAKAAYSQAATIAEKQNDANTEAIALLNRGNLRDWTGEPGGKDDFSTAAQKAPNDVMIVRRQIISLARDDQRQTAISLAESMWRQSKDCDIGILLATLLDARNQVGDRTKAHEICLEILENSDSPGQRAEVVSLLATGFAGLGRSQDGFALVEKNLAKISALAAETICGLIFLRIGNQEEAAKAAERGNAYLTSSDLPQGDQIRHAWLLFTIGKQAECVDILDGIVNPAMTSQEMDWLIECAQKAKRHDVLLRRYGELREAGIRNAPNFHNELMLLARYDPDKAVKVANNRLAEDSLDKQARLWLSILGLRLQRKNLLCSDPNSLPAINELLPEFYGTWTVVVLAAAGNIGASIRYAYDWLRRHYSNAAAHRAFVYALHATEVRNGMADSLLNAPAAIGPGCAVHYKEVHDQTLRFFVIEENDNPIAALNERSPDDELVKRFLGKKPGESIVISPSPIQDRIAVIHSVTNKYAYRCAECVDNYQVTFQDQSFIQKINVRSGGAIDLSAIIKLLNQRREAFHQATKDYANIPMPLHVFAETLGRHLFDAMEFFCEQSDLTLKCCHGTLEERESAFGLLRSGFTVVVDATALFTLSRLGRTDLLSLWPIKPVVSHSTKALIAGLLDQHRRTPENAVTVGLNSEGKLFTTRRSRDELLKADKMLSDLLQVIEEKCELNTCTEVASIDADKRGMLESLFGQHGTDSILLAARPNSILWTDDGHLADLARNEFQTRRIWTQVVAAFAVETDFVDDKSFRSACVRLLTSNYNFTWWDLETFRTAGETVKWKLGDVRLRRFFDELRNENVEWTMRVVQGAGIVKCCRTSEMTRNEQDQVVVRVLYRLAMNKNPEICGEALIHVLRKICIDNPRAARQAAIVIRMWIDFQLDAKPTHPYCQSHSISVCTIADGLTVYKS